MLTVPDVITLAQRLISIDTVNPPGNEEACVSVLRTLLESAGFRIENYQHAPGRASMVARFGACEPLTSLCFVGHVDTVPLGMSDWSHPPFQGDIFNGRLYGRGACDMKSGVSAMVCAILSRCQSISPNSELVLILVAGEETGCEGSSYLASHAHGLSNFNGVIVGEPTNNFPLVGHKGALWLQAGVRGKSAHGATPEQGINAIYEGMEVLQRLRGFCLCRPSHPVLGYPTLNVGTFQSGQNVNSVPDYAKFSLDLRTVPGIDHRGLQRELSELMHPQLEELTRLVDLPPVYTAPDNAWVQDVFQIIEIYTGQPAAQRTANYFTDASALSRVLGKSPVLILGPGRPEQMHHVDEYCDVDDIYQAVEIYKSIIDSTLGSKDLDGLQVISRSNVA